MEAGTQSGRSMNPLGKSSGRTHQAATGSTADTTRGPSWCREDEGVGSRHSLVARGQQRHVRQGQGVCEMSGKQENTPTGVATPVGIPSTGVVTSPCGLRGLVLRETVHRPGRRPH